MYIRGPWFKDRDPSNAEAVYWKFQPGDPHYPVQTRPPPAQLGPVTPNAASISKASSSNDPPQQTAPARQQQHSHWLGDSKPCNWDSHGSSKGQSWHSYHSERTQTCHQGRTGTSTEANETWRGYARPATERLEKKSVSRNPDIVRNEGAWRDPQGWTGTSTARSSEANKTWRGYARPETAWKDSKHVTSDGCSAVQSKTKRRTVHWRSDEASSADETVVQLQ